jgi:hypothetical protein
MFVFLLVKPAVSRGTYSIVKLHNSNPYAGIIRIRFIQLPLVLTVIMGMISACFCVFQEKQGTPF